MQRKSFTIAASILVLVAFGAGYLVSLMVRQPAVSAAGASTTLRAVTAPAVVTGSIDSAIEHAYDVASRSVVFVDNPREGTGSGIIYDGQGDIVTNAHVVSGGKKFTVTFSNGRSAPASLVGTDVADDLAVIRTTAAGLTPATFATSGSYRIAQTVLAIGSPLGLQDSVTSGLISGLNRTEQEPNGAYIPNAIQTSAPINPGNSGGALVSLSGVVVGIPTMVQTSDGSNATVQDVGFAIPSSRVTFIAGQLINSGHVIHTGRAFLGVSVGDAVQQNGPFGFYFGQGGSPSTVEGAVVNSVKANGPAGSAGIEQGDVITRFAGVSISSSDDLLAALARQKPGATVSVTFNRNGTSHTVSVRLAELPASA